VLAACPSLRLEQSAERVHAPLAGHARLVDFRENIAGGDVLPRSLREMHFREKRLPVVLHAHIYRCLSE